MGNGVVFCWFMRKLLLVDLKLFQDILAWANLGRGICTVLLLDLA